MIRVSYRRAEDRSQGDRWIGVLQDHGVAFIWCGHQHRNRDVSTRTNGEAAQVCARMILEGARKPQLAESRAEQMRGAWRSLTSGAGFQHPASVIEGARTACARNADAYLALVAEAREHPDLNDTEPTPVPAPAAPAEIGEIPDWML
jgi:hypothetical protein